MNRLNLETPRYAPRLSASSYNCVSKQIVADARVNNQRVVLEDLNGIRETGKAKCVHEWSFAQLQWMIRYKAAGAGVEVVDLSPRYTSQTCSRCLHLGVRPNQSSFECSDCGYRINADLNRAKSVAAKQDQLAKGHYFCEYPLEEVKGARGAVRSYEKKRQARKLKPQAPSTARPRA